MASDAFKSALSVVQKKVPTIIKNVNQNNFVKKLQLDSPRLSYAYGGGIKIGAFHRFFGPESGCKSTICTYIGGQFQKHLGEQFPELADHKYVVYCDIERSFDPEHAKENGIDLSEDRFLLLQPLNIEDMALSLEKLIETNQVACVIIDSESFLTTRTINEDEFNKACVSPDTKVDVLFEFEHMDRVGVSTSHNEVCEIEKIFKKAGYQDYKKEMKVGELYPIKNENFKIKIASMAFGKKTYKPVEYLVYKGEASEGYRVTTPELSFLATGEHKVYDFDKKEFVELKNINGNSFFGLDNSNNRVEVKIEKVKESFSILDLQVKETHTYFSGGILSHNTFGTVAKSLKEFCNRFGPLASEYNTTFFIISQERAQMAMMSHAIATCVAPDSMVDIIG